MTSFKKLSSIIIREYGSRMVINERVLRFYEETFDLSMEDLVVIKEKHSRLNLADTERVANTLKVLEAFNIDKTTAIQNPAVFIPHTSSIKNHAKVLTECGFAKLTPDYLIRYYGLVKKHTIEEIKILGMVPRDTDVFLKLKKSFTQFPTVFNTKKHLEITGNTLFDIRMAVMQLYLECRLGFKKAEFERARNIYYQFRHRPLIDVEESIKIALDEIQMPLNKIMSYPYVMCADPENTRKIIDEVRDLNGIDAREALRICPGMINANYKKILEIKTILKDHNFSVDVQKRALLLYTLRPSTIKARIKEMESNKVYMALSASERSLLLVLYKNKVQNRLTKFEASNKKCIKLPPLLQSNQQYESYLKSFGDKSNPDEIIKALTNLLTSETRASKDVSTFLKKNLSQHCFWDCVPIISVIETANMLLEEFSKEEILKNCHLVFYPTNVVAQYISLIKKRLEKISSTSVVDSRNEESTDDEIVETISNEDCLDYVDSDDNDMENDDNDCATDENSLLSDKMMPNHLLMGNLKMEALTNTQLLALTLYFIEKEHLFSGDGIWENQNSFNKCE